MFKIIVQGHAYPFQSQLGYFGRREILDPVFVRLLACGIHGRERLCSKGLRTPNTSEVRNTTTGYKSYKPASTKAREGFDKACSQHVNPRPRCRVDPAYLSHVRLLQSVVVAVKRHVGGLVPACRA